MAFDVGQRVNRPVVGLHTSAHTLTGFVALKIKIDSSQQLLVEGIHYGFFIPTPADDTLFQTGYCVGYLNPNFDPITLPSGSPTVIDQTLGDVFFTDSLAPTERSHAIKFETPIPLNGDQSICVIVPAPRTTGAGFANNWFIHLALFGTITQLQPQDQPRLGDWSLR